ncbi:MAG: hypothetical protein KKA79_08205 [Nanoarchaeota archaeon]|nr:hypothetical protein [Nanoarchaeota archaeon]MCG2718155.1 hypothetical protein [Nanoarchaeota archaeon]
MIKPIIISGLLGGVGGFVRSLVGLSKAFSAGRKLRFTYFFVTMTISIAVGCFAGVIFNYDYKFSMLAGYAGTDILEAGYKSKSVQKGYTNVKKFLFK